MSNPIPPAGAPAIIPPSPASSFKLTGNAALDSMIGMGLFGAATALAGWAVANITWLNRMDTTTLALILFGLLGAGATAVWKFLNSQANTASAVQAGVSLAFAGASELQRVNGLVIPKPVTSASAQEIVKNYADTTVTIPNAAEVVAALEPTQIVKT